MISDCGEFKIWILKTSFQGKLWFLFALAENNDLFEMVKGDTKKQPQQMPLGVALDENNRPVWEQKVFFRDLFFYEENIINPGMSTSSLAPFMCQATS